MLLITRAIALLSILSGSSGFFFWSKSDSAASKTRGGADHDVSALLSRLDSLEEKVEKQQDLIESLETLITTGRMLSDLDQECYMTFFNETGTPTCMVNYHLTAEHGLDVLGDSNFAPNGNMEVHSRASFYDEPVTFQQSVSFQSPVDFLDNVTYQAGSDVSFLGPMVSFSNRTNFYGEAQFRDAQFLDSVEFLSDVVYKANSDVTFQGPVSVTNRADFLQIARFREKAHFFDSVVYQHGADTEFKDTVLFQENVDFGNQADVHFRDRVYFHENVKFENGADVRFEDTVTVRDDFTIDGHSRGHPITFEVKDKVDVRFRQDGDMIVDVETTFHDDVKLEGMPCDDWRRLDNWGKGHGKGHGKGGSCSSSDESVPELFVDGDITARSDIHVEHGKIEVDTISPVGHSSEVLVQGELKATQDITSQHGFVSPIDQQEVLHGIENQNISVGRLIATVDVRTSGDVAAGGSVQADVDITAGRDVTADQDVAANRDVIADADHLNGGTVKVGDVAVSGAAMTFDQAWIDSTFSGKDLSVASFAADHVSATTMEARSMTGSSIEVGTPQDSTPILTSESTLTAKNFDGANLDDVALTIKSLVASRGVLGNSVSVGQPEENTAVITEDITLAPRNFDGANLEGVHLDIGRLTVDGKSVLTEIQASDLAGLDLSGDNSLSDLSVDRESVLTTGSALTIDDFTLTAENFQGADLTSVDLVVNSLVGTSTVLGSKVAAFDSDVESVLSSIESQETGIWYYDGDEFCSRPCLSDGHKGKGKGHRSY